jgi:long-chain acyl-CoA synthetase
MGRITHGNLLHFVSRFPSLVDIGPNDVCLVSLPLWHLYGRLAVYTTLSVGARASFAPLSELPEALETVRPTVFPTFPVVWESLYHQLIEIARARPVRARLLHAAMLLSRHRLGLRRVAGKREIRLAPEHAVAAAARQAGALVLGAMLAPAHWLAGRTVYRQALRMLGGRMRLTILGDAAVPEYVEDVLQAMGIGVVQGYGSTEQIVSILRQSGNHPAGTLGDVFPGTRLRLLKDDGAPAAPAEPAEIAVSGPQVFAGYWRNEALDRRCLRRLEDGRWWYFTGDLAMRDHHDNLVFVGRRDNTFRHPTSGNPVHPERCESMLRESVYIRGAMLFPEMGSMTVLIVPDPRELFRWHALNAGAVTSEFARLPVDPFAVLAFVDSHPREMRELVRDPRTVALYRDRIKRLTRNRLLRTDEVPERFCIAESALMPGRELTHTLKLRREPVRTTILPGLPRHRI